MKSKILFILPLVLFFFYGTLHAQSTVLSAGSDALGTSGTVSFSIGQTIFSTYSNEALSIIEGVQQPYEIFIISQSEEPNDNIKLIIYPNPSENHIILNIENYEKRNLSYQFYNSLGQLLGTNLIIDQKTTLNTEDLSPATYFLMVIEDKSIIKTFKILKK